MPRSRKDAEAVADKLGLTGDDREEYVVRLSGEAAPAAAPAPDPSARPQPPYTIPDGGFDGVTAERKAPTRPAIKAPAPAPVVIAPDDVSGLVDDAPRVNIIPRPQPAEQAPTRMRPLSSLPGDVYGTLAPAPETALPPVEKPAARRQVVADTLGLPGAKVYREAPAARPAPVDAFRADYEFLVSQGYPQAQLDQFIAEKGAAELSKVAASKRGGK